jgi:hypothetical protein
MNEKVTSTKGDDMGTIESLINYLIESKKKGATHYKMRWSGDPMWAFKWFETFRIKSDEEVKQEQIDKLEKEIAELKKR